MWVWGKYPILRYMMHLKKVTIKQNYAHVCCSLRPSWNIRKSETCLRISEKAGSCKWDITLVCMSNLVSDLHVRHLVCGLEVILEE